MVSSGISDVAFASVQSEKTRQKKLMMRMMIIIMMKNRKKRQFLAAPESTSAIKLRPEK